MVYNDFRQSAWRIGHNAKGDPFGYSASAQTWETELKQMEWSNSIMTKKINQVFKAMVNYELSRGTAKGKVHRKKTKKNRQMSVLGW